MKKFRKIGELMLMVLFTATVMTVSAVIVLIMYRFTPHLMPFVTTLCLGAVLLNVIADVVEEPSASVTDVFDFAVSVIEKQIPMKATYSSPLWYICPKCGGSISIENIQEHIYESDTTYCEHCGQALDWSENNA